MHIVDEVWKNARPAPTTISEFQDFDQFDVVLLHALTQQDSFVDESLKTRFLSLFVNDDSVWSAGDEDADPDYFDELAYNCMNKWAKIDPVVDLNALRK